MIRIIPDFPMAEVIFSLLVDGIAQEIDETFKLSFANLQLSDRGLFPTRPISVGKMNGTIVDNDCELRVGFRGRKIGARVAYKADLVPSIRPTQYLEFDF